MQRVQKGDLVQVITGADRGKQGHVIAVDHARGRVRVEQVAMRKRHLKPGRAGAQQGGVVEDEGFIHASNVSLVNPADSKPSRVRIETKDGARGRVFTRGGQSVPGLAKS
jgi:large subunit ribosomal protein L24